MIRYDKFKKYVRKLSRPLQQVILDEVEDVLANPDVGELKEGDLTGFRVHKFTLNRQLTLMAYQVENDFLILYQVGPHENFYKNLKRYVKEMGG